MRNKVLNNLVGPCGQEGTSLNDLDARLSLTLPFLSWRWTLG